MTDTNIRDIIESLLDNTMTSGQPVIPDGVDDYSAAVTPLRRLTLYGRALRSSDEYSIGKMLGQLLHEYIPADHTTQDLERCVLGLTILVAKLLRSINERSPHISIEDFLVDAASQDSLIELGRSMSSIPTTTSDAGHQRPSIAHHPLFRDAIPLPPEAIDEFINRHVAPYDDEEQLDFDLNFELIVHPERGPDLFTPSPPPKVSIDSDATFGPLDGFDEFFDAYLKRKEEGDI